MQHDRLQHIARTYVWWKPPVEALADEKHFLAQVMNLGTWEDEMYILETFGEDRLRAVLRDAPPGLFSPRSWHFWHYRLGLEEVPPLPKRKLD
jgi:hypothetical protein